MYLERPRCHFQTGDKIRMLEDGFTIAKGAVVTAGKISWVKGRGWCVDVRVKEHHANLVGFLARRFEYAEENEMEDSLYVIVEMDSDGVIQMPITWMRGTYKEVEAAVRKSLVTRPEAQFQFGRMDRKAFVDSPPVRIQSV
jgi:hypothetical protein